MALINQAVAGASASNVISVPKEDIATNEHLISLSVGVPGRIKSEMIYTSVGTNLSYDEVKDSPPVGETTFILATPEEKQRTHGAIRCVVVGVILADDPFKHAPNTRNPPAVHLPMYPRRRFLRVVVPVTYKVKLSSIKYFVCCRPKAGIFELRVIRRECVFFFAEVMSKIDLRDPIKERRAHIGHVCRTLAFVGDSESGGTTHLSAMAVVSPDSQQDIVATNNNTRKRARTMIDNSDHAKAILTESMAATMDHTIRVFTATRTAMELDDDTIADICKRAADGVHEVDVQRLKTQICGIQAACFKILGIIATAEEETGK